MQSQYYAGQGSRMPSIRETLLDPDGEAIDLTGATTVFRYQPKDRSVVAHDIAAVTEGDPVLGTVRVDWGAGDTDTAGLYDAQWIVTFVDGREMMVPNFTFYTLVVWAKLSTT